MKMKLGTKLLVTFIGIVVLVGGGVGTVSYLNQNRVSDIVHEITDQRVPTVKNATAVERYALRTIMDEKMYLLAVGDAAVDETTYQQSAMSNIAQISAALDEVDKVATKYNDQNLLSTSQEVRTGVEE